MGLSFYYSRALLAYVSAIATPIFSIDGRTLKSKAKFYVINGHGFFIGLSKSMQFVITT